MSEEKPVLFIADLHLNDRQPEIYHRFKHFLDSKARDSRALYILGDLFEYYLGDDALSPMMLQVCADLKELSEKHQVNCFFMHGNRDFLVADVFAEKAGLKILEDPFVLDLNDQSLILTHSDQLCTDDTAYQAVRQQLRNPQWQQGFLAMSIEERIKFADDARQKSKQHTQSASADIMDVNQQQVQVLMDQFQLTTMLHGHTHRPAFHHYQHDGREFQRMVLGDWHYQCSYIEYQNQQFRLLSC